MTTTYLVNWIGTQMTYLTVETWSPFALVITVGLIVTWIALVLGSIKAN